MSRILLLCRVRSIHVGRGVVVVEEHLGDASHAGAFDGGTRGQRGAKTKRVGMLPRLGWR